VAITHTSPRLGRLRRPKAQRAKRRPGVRDGSPAVHAVASKAFDGAGGRGHADGVFVHNLTVANLSESRWAGAQNRVVAFPLDVSALIDRLRRRSVSTGEFEHRDFAAIAVDLDERPRR